VDFLGKLFMSVPVQCPWPARLSLFWFWRSFRISAYLRLLRRPSVIAPLLPHLNPRRIFWSLEFVALHDFSETTFFNYRLHSLLERTPADFLPPALFSSACQSGLLSKTFERAVSVDRLAMIARFKILTSTQAPPSHRIFFFSPPPQRSCSLISSSVPPPLLKPLTAVGSHSATGRGQKDSI